MSLTTDPPGGFTSLGALLAPPQRPALLGRLAALAHTPAPLSGLTGLARAPTPSGIGFSALPYAPPIRWIAVRDRFKQFHRNLALTPAQHADGLTKRAGVVECLNSAYYGIKSDTANSILAGSWGKDTMKRPPRDVDVLFVLPVEVYYRFENYSWARQSALLREVKDKLAVTYPNTEMRGDGQVVLVKFASYSVEVVPAFALRTPGQYWICDTNDGGSYRTTAPWAEINQLDAADKTYTGNLRPLIRMGKAWQDWCSVPLKSFKLELLATEFLAQSPWRFNDWFWFDWLLRDFFAYLYQRANGVVVIPGTNEVVELGVAWQSRALTAYLRAAKACEYEYNNLVADAGEEWQKIFGTDMPRTV